MFITTGNNLNGTKLAICHQCTKKQKRERMREKDSNARPDRISGMFAMKKECFGMLENV